MKQSCEINYPILKGPLSVGDIIGRAWQVYLYNFYNVSLYSAIFIVIPTCFSIYGGILLDYRYMVLIFELIFNFPVLALIILIILPVLANFTFIVIFNSIIHGKYITFKEYLNILSRKFRFIIIFCGIYFFEVVIFIVVDILAYIGLGYLLFVSAMFVYNILPKTGLFDLINYVGGPLIFILFIMFLIIIFVSQIFFSIIQLITVVVEEISVKLSFMRAFEFVNTGRFFVFSMILTLICFFLYYGFIITVDSILEIAASMFDFGVSEIREFYLSLGEAVTPYLALIIIWPLMVSSVLLYYFDIRIRKEGFDLFEAIRIEKEIYSGAKKNTEH